MHRHIAYYSLLVALTVLAGCESYDFTVNDNLVYTPKQLFSDFDVPDPALYECIKQAIIDSNSHSAEQLSRLNCSHAGITDLTGLATFTALVQLKLSSNNIRNLAQVSVLSQLQELHLDDNVVVDPVPLYQLAKLRVLDLDANTPLQCPAASAFATVDSLKLPKHCK